MSYIASVYEPGMQGLEVPSEQNNRGITPHFAIINTGGIEQEIVKLKCTGDDLMIGVFPVDDAMKARFPVEYKAWKEGRATIHQGTLLSEWKDLPDAIRGQLEDAGIRTIDQFAAVADSNLNHVLQQDGRLWRDRALAWLSANRIDPGYVAMKAQLEAMKAKIARLEAARPKKRSHQRVRPRPLPEAVAAPCDVFYDGSNA